MKLPAYPRTKPSGVEWLGDVPEHWAVKRLRYLCSIRKGRLPSETFPSATSDGDLPYLSMEFLRGESDAPNFVAPAPSLVRAEAGDLLLLWDGSNAGEFMRAKKGVVSSTVARLETRQGEQVFLAYACKALEPQIKDQTVGMGIPHVSGDELKSCSLPYPDSAEQRSIAAFLDRETGRVDRLVATQREMIERLKEKRTALISRTVTRGLPPAAARAAGLLANPSLKSSGHPWLDDIPKHWEVKRLKEVSVLFGRIGFRGYSTDDLVYEGEGAISMSPSNMADGVVSLGKCTWLSWGKYHESPEIQVQPEDVIMVKTGSTLGKTAFVRTVPVPMTVNPQLMIFKEVKCSKRFLFYYLFSNVVQDVIPLHNTGSTIPTMTQEGIGKLPFPHPPLPEQAAIAAYLDMETAKLDALVGKVEEAVERLQEYRTALITAAVTGKIDVRKKSHA